MEQSRIKGQIGVSFHQEGVEETGSNRGKSKGNVCLIRATREEVQCGVRVTATISLITFT